MKEENLKAIEVLNEMNDILIDCSKRYKPKSTDILNMVLYYLSGRIQVKIDELKKE
jgi:hypothetical protein